MTLKTIHQETSAEGFLFEEIISEVIFSTQTHYHIRRAFHRTPTGTFDKFPYLLIITPLYSTSFSNEHSFEENDAFNATRLFLCSDCSVVVQQPPGYLSSPNTIIERRLTIPTGQLSRATSVNLHR